MIVDEQGKRVVLGYRTWQEAQPLDGEEHLIIVSNLPALEATFIWDSPVEWVMPLGDNWVATWTWAKDLERDTGVDYQVALRAARDRYF